jgi:hypothetical protein
VIVHEAMIYVISRSVPRELQPGVVAVALAGLPLPWTQILGIPEPEVIGLLSEFYLGRADLVELSGLSGGWTGRAPGTWARSQAEQAFHGS